MKTYVRVSRNRYGRPDQPWLVHCSLCTGGDDSFIAAMIGRPLGWAPSWRIAQDFAAKHALKHEATRCTTCLHLPAVPITEGASA